MAFEIAKPFLWLALAAFLVGFLSYATVARDTLGASVTGASAPGPSHWSAARRI